LLFSSNLLAGNASGEFLIGLSAGPTWTSGNNSQTINLEPDVAKTYTANNNSHAFTSGELFIGWQAPGVTRFMEQPFISQLGLSIAGAGNAKLSGDGKMPIQILIILIMITKYNMRWSQSKANSLAILVLITSLTLAPVSVSDLIAHMTLASNQK
jgi:hypothetical protein